MMSSDKSGQMRPASNESGRQTCWEQAADRASKRQERTDTPLRPPLTMTTRTYLINKQQTMGVREEGGGGEEEEGGGDGGGGEEEEDFNNVTRRRS